MSDRQTGGQAGLEGRIRTLQGLAKTQHELADNYRTTADARQARGDKYA